MPFKLQSGHYYGQTLRARTVADFILTESQMPPHLELARHSHSNAYFCGVLQGSFTENFEGRLRLCQPSTLKFHPPGELHSENFHDRGARLFRVEIRPKRLSDMREHSNVLDRPVAFQGGALAQLTLKLYNEFLNADEVSHLAIEGLALEITAEAVRRSPVNKTRRPPRWLKQTVEILHSQFADLPSLSEIAQTVGVHPVHLATVFRRQHGCTIADYVRTIRVEFACDKLTRSQMPLVEIALAAGFSDQSHFSRVFKLHTHLSPSEFRRLCGPLNGRLKS